MGTLKKIFFSAVVLVFFMICCELVLAFFAIDLILLKKTLYYQRADLEVHRTFRNAERLYELSPGVSAKYTCGLHPGENKYQERAVTVNRLGFRGREFPRDKAKGVIRIVVLGGSTTYGFSVSDEDTYPALMQEIFNKRYPGRIEVWNAGVCAYNMSQIAAYAREIIRDFYPDVLILQDNNRGRRPFLLNVTLKELKPLFRANRELYAENLPLLSDNSDPAMEKIHHFLIVRSALYRIFRMGLYARLGAYGPNSDAGQYGSACSAYGQIVNKRSFHNLAKKHKDISIVLFNPLSRYAYMDRADIKDNVRFFSFDAARKPEEYGDIHPPSYVYPWYARELCDYLTVNGYLERN